MEIKFGNGTKINVQSLDDVLLNFRAKAKFNVGDEVRLDFKHSYQGVSLRSRILRKLCAEWQQVKLTNDPRYGKKKCPHKKEAADYLRKKRVCLGKLWDEKKDWIQSFMKTLDSKKYKAFVFMVEPSCANGINYRSNGSIYYTNDRFGGISLRQYHVIFVAENGNQIALKLLSDQIIKAIK